MFVGGLVIAATNRHSWIGVPGPPETIDGVIVTAVATGTGASVKFSVLVPLTRVPRRSSWKPVAVATKLTSATVSESNR
jgi:hypothetical protein